MKTKNFRFQMGSFLKKHIVRIPSLCGFKYVLSSGHVNALKLLFNTDALVKLFIQQANLLHFDATFCLQLAAFRK